LSLNYLTLSAWRSPSWEPFGTMTPNPDAPVRSLLLEASASKV